MKIIITGSSGFIGGHLTSFLSGAGYDVIEADITSGCDVTKWDDVAQLPAAEYVVHLAAITHVEKSYQMPRGMYTVNIQGTLNMLEYCRVQKASMIFNSSYVYGQPKYFPIDEEHPLESFNPYSQSKIIGEKLCQSYYRDFQVPAIIFRPFNIYGRNQTPNFLIPGIIEQIRNKQTITLQNPHPKRDYVYIDDLMQAYLMAIRSGRKSAYDIYNIGTGKSYSAKEIAEKIVALSKIKAEIRFSGASRKSEVLDTVADAKKIREQLGWSPGFSLEDGLKDLLNKNGLL
ncbi:MAG: NAD(P)-dependent oxidoreductase [Candidatus Marinimicrobia bacterium]|jgi:UDP-glucose 4-epimerase|nr:NAD(P)-dependent oxidoreductase [Candidatus Neomarinimicrobiota bacterium]MDX9777911.1 NAD(P)-dependent oxidoreductase [bacterium]